LAVAATTGAMLLLTPRSAPAHAVPSPCDFTTGGGWVIIPEEGGDQGNFGIVGGCKNDGFYGHINWVDHNTGLHVNGPVTMYLDPFPTSDYRDLCGTAKTNDPGNPTVKFRVRTLDVDEPGGLDRFGIALSTGYVVSTRELGPPGQNGGGGNIQRHKPNPSNTGGPGDESACADDTFLDR
jgi:hypothetical protein